MTSLIEELGDAARALHRRAAVAPAVVLTLAVGIGASVLVFSAVNAVILRPLPVRDLDRLVVLWEEDLDRDRHPVEVSFANFEQWRESSQSFENMAAMGSHDWGFVLIGDGEPERLPYRAVAASFFETLGVEALLGRTLRREDDEPEAERVVVLSHGLWRRRFAKDPAIVGRLLSFETERGLQSFTVVGVMPAEFRFPPGAQAWAPAGREMADVQALHGLSDDAMRDIGVFAVVARTKPGTTFEQAEAEMDALVGRLGESINRRTGSVLTPFPEYVFGNTRAALAALLAAVSLVLLIACANVSNLLLARALGRERSFAIRRALGASRARIVRGILLESLLLSLTGALLGLGLAHAGLDVVAALAPAGVPQLEEVSIDRAVFTFAASLSVVTATLVSLLPIAGMRDARLSSRSMARRSGRGVPAWLVVFEVALSVVVLVGAGLVGKSFVKLNRTDLGFDPLGVLAFDVSPSPLRYPGDAERRSFYSDLLQRIESLPGVDAAGAALLRPYQLGSIGQDGWIHAEGQAEDARGRNPVVNWQVATEGYFRTMGIRLLRGRTFETTDDERAIPVAVVGESLASRLWPRQDPIGRRVQTNDMGAGADGEPRFITVVGVVEDVRYRELERARPNLYVSWLQARPTPRHLSFVLLTEADPESFAAAVAEKARTIDPNEPIETVISMEAVVWNAKAPWRFTMTLFGGFGVVAVLLTALGVFSVLSRSVVERGREWSVRIAVGARAEDVVGLVVGRSMGWIAGGTALGLGLALAGTRFLESLLFDVEPGDVSVYAATLALVLAVGLLASSHPARRAALTDPSEVLKSE